MAGQVTVAAAPWAGHVLRALVRAAYSDKGIWCVDERLGSPCVLKAQIILAEQRSYVRCR